MANKGIYKDKDRNTWFIDKKKVLSNGSIVHVKKRGFRSKAEADAKFDFYMNKAIRDANYKMPNEIFNDLVDQWLLYKKTLVKKSSFYSANKTVGKYINPFFDNSNIDNALQSDRLQSFRDYLSCLPYKVDWKNKILHILLEVIEYGYNKGYILPKKFQDAKFELVRFSSSETIKTSRKTMTKNEFQDFISSFSKEDKYLFLFEFLIFTGCRIGELCALQWKDFDIEKKVIHIYKTASSHMGTGKIEVTTPKTYASNREIAFTEEFLEKIISFKKSFINVENDRYVFFNKRTPLNQNTIRGVLNRHQKLANIQRHFSPHEFRHTNITWLLDKCSNLEEIDVVRKRLGHSSLKTTLDVYYHSNPDRQREIASRIDDIIK